MYIFRHFVCHITIKCQIPLYIVLSVPCIYNQQFKNPFLPLESTGKIQYNGFIENLSENLRQSLVLFLKHKSVRKASAEKLRHRGRFCSGERSALTASGPFIKNKRSTVKDLINVRENYRDREKFLGKEIRIWLYRSQRRKLL